MQCKCGALKADGAMWCSKCSWGNDDDEPPISSTPSVVKPTPKFKLTCFTTCPICQKQYRGARCLACKSKNPPMRTCFTCKEPCELKYCSKCTDAYCRSLHVKKDSKKQPKKESTENQKNEELHCQTCTKKIMFGKFCSDCKKTFRESWTKFCQSCPNKVADDRFYCATCTHNYNTPRPCLSCPQMTQKGIYCETCKEAYKSKLQTLA